MDIGLAMGVAEGASLDTGTGSEREHRAEPAMAGAGPVALGRYTTHSTIPEYTQQPSRHLWVVGSVVYLGIW